MVSIKNAVSILSKENTVSILALTMSYMYDIISSRLLFKNSPTRLIPLIVIYKRYFFVYMR